MSDVSEKALREAYRFGYADGWCACADEQPPIDAVPVVRCKDCKYYKEGVVLSPQKFCFRLRGRNGEAIGYNFADDDFCSYGERSEEGSLCGGCDRMYTQDCCYCERVERSEE